MVSEEQMTPGCVTPVSHHFRVLKVQWNQVIFLWNWPKTRSPCTVHVALSLAAGKSPSLCISRLHVSLSHHIWGDGMTLPSTTPWPAWWGAAVLAQTDGGKSGGRAVIWKEKSPCCLLVTQALFWGLNSVKSLHLLKGWPVSSEIQK